MKRQPALQKLSREHHSALVLSLRIARLGDGAAPDDLLASVSQLFQAELEPHFQEEEADLLPRLTAAGQGELVARTLEEHRQLRELAAAMALGDRGSLKPFGKALGEHVRFEERELFVAAEACLPAAFLQNPS